MRPYLLLGRRRDHQTSAVGELHERPAHSRTASAANERSSPATGIEGLGAKAWTEAGPMPKSRVSQTTVFGAQRPMLRILHD